MDEPLNSLLPLLTAAKLPKDISPVLLYQAAAFGTVVMLCEAASEPTSQTEAVAAMCEIILHGTNETLRQRVMDSLMDLAEKGSETVEDAVFELLIKEHSPIAIDAFTKIDLNHRDPGHNAAKYAILHKRPDLFRKEKGLAELTVFYLSSEGKTQEQLIHETAEFLPNWHSIIVFLISPNEENREMLLNCYEKFNAAEKEVLYRLISVRFPEQLSLIADIVLRYEEPAALQVCIQTEAQPHEKENAALFFFLSEQWKKYEDADSGYRKIRKAYEEGSSELRHRLVEVSRRSGNLGWLQDVEATADFGTRKKTLSLSDWESVLRNFRKKSDWEKIWSMIPKIPAVWIPRAMQMLADAKFRPTNPEEADFYEQMSTLTKSGAGLIPIPLDRKFFTENKHPTAIECGGEYFAVAFLNGEIQVWNYKDGKDPGILIHGIGTTIRQLCFSSDDAWLVAGCADASCRVFEIPTGKMVKQINLKSSSLISFSIRSDNRRITLIDGHADVSIFAFPFGTPIGTVTLPIADCSRAIFDPLNDRLTAFGSDGNSCVYDFQKDQFVSGFSLQTGILTAGSRSENDLICGIDQKGRLFCRNILSGRMLVEAVETGFPSDHILQLLPLFSDETVFVGTGGGSCSALHLTDGQRLANIITRDGKNTITGLALSADESLLFSTSANGDISAWDLQMFHWMTTAFTLEDLPGLSRIDDWEKKQQTIAAKNAAEILRTIVTWRRRFDIEVEIDLL